jgi:hypothetical protein
MRIEAPGVLMPQSATLDGVLVVAPREQHGAFPEALFSLIKLHNKRYKLYQIIQFVSFA